MSDDRRDEGFDLFDFNAPEEERIAGDASSEPPTDEGDQGAFDELMTDEADTDAESRSRFSEFMAAMSGSRSDEADDEPGDDDSGDDEAAADPNGFEAFSLDTDTDDSDEAGESASRFAEFQKAFAASAGEPPAVETPVADEMVAPAGSAPDVVAASASGEDDIGSAAVDDALDELAGADGDVGLHASSAEAAAEPADPDDSRQTYRDFRQTQPSADVPHEAVGFGDEIGDVAGVEDAPAASYRGFAGARGDVADAGADTSMDSGGDAAVVEMPPVAAVEDEAEDAPTVEPSSGTFRAFAESQASASDAAPDPLVETGAEASAPTPAGYRDFLERRGDLGGAGGDDGLGTEVDDAFEASVAGSTSSYRDYLESIVESGAGADTAAEADEAVTNWDSFTDEQYVKTTTQEYSVLAEELAKQAQEPTQQSAVAADIPGLRSGMVGLEDVAGEHAGAELDVRTAADVGLRVLTGIGLLIIFGAALLWPLAIGALAALVFLLAAGEFSAVLIRNDYRPIVPLILAGTLGCLVGTWLWGLVAVPIMLASTLIIAGLIFGVASPARASAVNAALTILVVGWIGGLGSFVFPLLESDDYRWLIGGLVIAIVAMDVGQFFVGRRFGSRPLAPVISPKKTVEGLIGGAIAAIIFSIALAFLAPYDYQTAAQLALAAIVLGPLGDLSVSLVKRILGIKDMGTVLPGHGGILDRIDALLFMIPAAWIVFRVAGFVT